MTATQHPSHFSDLQSLHQGHDEFHHAATTQTRLDELAQLASRRNRVLTDRPADTNEIQSFGFTPLSSDNMPIYYPSLVAHQRSIELLLDQQQQQTSSLNHTQYGVLSSTVSQPSWPSHYYTDAPQTGIDPDQISSQYDSGDSISTGYASVFNDNSFQGSTALHAPYEGSYFTDNEDDKALQLSVPLSQLCSSPFSALHHASDKRIDIGFAECTHFNPDDTITKSIASDSPYSQQDDSLAPMQILGTESTWSTVQRPMSPQIEHDRAEIAILASRTSGQRHCACTGSPQLHSDPRFTSSASYHSTLLIQESRWTTAWDQILRATTKRRETVRARKFDCRSRARTIAEECVNEKRARDELRGSYRTHTEHHDGQKVQGTWCLVDAMYPKDIAQVTDIGGFARIQPGQECSRARPSNAIVERSSYEQLDSWNDGLKQTKPRGYIDDTSLDADVDTSSDILVYGMRYRPLAGMVEHAQTYNDELEYDVPAYNDDSGHVGALGDVDMNTVGVSKIDMYDYTVDEADIGNATAISTVEYGYLRHGWNDHAYASNNVARYTGPCTATEQYETLPDDLMGGYNIRTRSFSPDLMACGFEPAIQPTSLYTPQRTFTAMGTYPSFVGGSQSSFLIGVDRHEDQAAGITGPGRMDIDFGYGLSL